MMLAINELTREEEIAFLGLLKVIIRADHQLSNQEHAEVRRIATMMGSERFAERISEAQRLFSNLSEIKAYVATIQRSAARELIYSLLFHLAERDGLSTEEEELLTWLGEVWEIAPPASDEPSET